MMKCHMINILVFFIIYPSKIMNKKKARFSKSDAFSLCSFYTFPRSVIGHSTNIFNRSPSVHLAFLFTRLPRGCIFSLGEKNAPIEKRTKNSSGKKMSVKKYKNASKSEGERENIPVKFSGKFHL